MNAFAKLKHHFRQPAKVIKSNIIHVPNEQWKDNKKRMFQWADNQAAKHGYNGNTINVLKELINCTDLKGITFATIETIYNRLVARHGKAAPSKRTIDRCLVRLVEGKSIKRSTQERVKTLVKTRLLIGKLVSGSTSLCRTEYISPKRYIYTGKAISNSIAAFPSTSNQNFQKSSRKTVSAPPLGAAALTVTTANKNEPEIDWRDLDLEKFMLRGGLRRGQ